MARRPGRQPPRRWPPSGGCRCLAATAREVQTTARRSRPLPNASRSWSRAAVRPVRPRGEGCPMSRFLIMTWDGAGNLAPTLGIARTLVERGHDVRLMGHRTIAERCGDVGTRFVPLSQGELWDA